MAEECVKSLRSDVKIKHSENALKKCSYRQVLKTDNQSSKLNSFHLMTHYYTENNVTFVVAVPKAKLVMCCFICLCVCVCGTCSGSTTPSESRKENMAEVSLICEENLLDTIFFACDTQRRGRTHTLTRRRCFITGAVDRTSFCNVITSLVHAILAPKKKKKHISVCLFG